jgi:tetratricopeptide (TPR) repeat protein
MQRARLNHIDDPGKFGRRLRDTRLQAGVSQQTLSFPGCSAAYISRIEAGERTPSLQVIREMAKRLGVSPEYLATGVQVEPTFDRELVDAEVLLRLGELNDARDVFLRRLNDDPQEGVALAGLGEIAFREGHLNKAVTLLEQSLERASLVERASNVETLARAQAGLGALESAEALLERAIAEAQAASASVECFRFRVLLANVLIDRDDPTLAGRQLAAAIHDAEALHDPIATARVFWTQSRLHVHHDNPRLGARYAQRAIEILERTENQAYLAMAYHLLAYAQIEAGDPDAALAQLERGRAAFGPSLTPADESRFALEEIRALTLKGDAKAAAQQAGAVLAKIGELEPADRGRTYMTIAHVFRSSGDTARAVELYELALEYLERDGSQYLPEVGTNLAELHEELGQPEKALDIYKRVFARGPQGTVTTDGAGKHAGVAGSKSRSRV